MAEPKTRPTDASVPDFLAEVPNARRRDDAAVVDALMQRIAGEQPVMWGPTIVGYGETEITGSRGTTSTWPVVAFSPRKAELVLYLESDLDSSLFDRLGPHRRSVACLYIKRLDQIDMEVLTELVERSVAQTLRGGAPTDRSN